MVAVALVATVAFQPALAGTPLSSRVLGSPVPRFVGKVSYGIFLWQLLIGAAFFTVLRLKGPFQGGRYNGLQTLGIMAAVALLSTAAATVRYYLFVEVRPAAQGGSGSPSSSQARAGSARRPAGPQ